MKKKTMGLGLILLVLISLAFLTQHKKSSYSNNKNSKLLNVSHKVYTAQKYVTNKKYNDRVFYEIFVRAFNDSNGDRIGDLKGVTEKLDYLKDLGVSGIWLMPINASPSYHGYDISDYYSIQQDYGTMDDFYNLINEAHKRDIAVFMDLVINHTSSKNPMFIESANNKKSKYRNYYNWTNDKGVINEHSTIGTMPWVYKNNSFYYAMFDQGMPDLNYDNKNVRAEVKNIAKYYLNMGVDGFRLDAAKHIYDGNTNKNLQWWKEFETYIKGVNKSAFAVGEVSDNKDVVANYMTSLDSCFDFELSTDILDTVKNDNINELGTEINDVYKSYKSKNKDYNDSTFLSNHDFERVMSRLNSVDKCKEAAAILLTLPGTPYIYYGEETGMTGAKPDENIRQPFIWSNKDKNKNTYWEEIYNDKNLVAVNVQEANKNSLLNFYKTFIKIRNNNEALRNGSFENIDEGKSNIFAFKRSSGKEEIYTMINGDQDSKCTGLPSMNAQVIYSSDGNNQDLNITGTLNLKKNQILVVKRKN
ncbi:alpha-amylase family glycosyl hydrolase [Clostridium guangxiense]|uniref:alpha-amylase family glycosyl hydrolase n=2 Tax=Clostridium TaxID=1485 RepID=UPI001E28D147|nr:alpha-amylase family glycosyl hydrolase [Clostridium guangxiense]MCD2348036.1 alpha-amylase [Clostridium guangxiense]